MPWLHRIAYVHPQTRAVLCAGTTTTPQGRTLIEPRPIVHHPGDGEPFRPLIVPMEEHSEHWLRLQGEFAHSNYPMGHSLHGQTPVGDVGRCIHEGGTPHPTLDHILLPGTFRWTEPVHPRVQEHIDFLRAKSDADLIRHFTGLEPENLTMYHPTCTLRLRHLQLRLAYDASVVCETFVDVIGPDGKDTELKHGYGHRIPPNKWLAMTVPDIAREAIHSHHAALGLNPPKDEILHLHPEGHPGTQHFAPVPDKPKVELPENHEEQVREYIDRVKRAELYPNG